jgi:hypothetical protein
MSNEWREMTSEEYNPIISKTTIADAGNVLVPAYLALIQKGYSVSHEKLGSEKKELWIAENSSNRFVAEDPLLLLGLISLYETRGEKWQASDNEIEAFFKKFGVEKNQE